MKVAPPLNAVERQVLATLAATFTGRAKAANWMPGGGIGPTQNQWAPDPWRA